MTKRKQKREFSKTLLIQESILIWIHTLAHIALAFMCIILGFTGSLPWLAASAGLPWAAYGVSQVYYYKKSLVENSKDGIKYDSVMKSLDQAYGNSVETAVAEDFTSAEYDTSMEIDLDYGI